MANLYTILRSIIELVISVKYLECRPCMAVMSVVGKHLPSGEQNTSPYMSLRLPSACVAVEEFNDLQVTSLYLMTASHNGYQFTLTS